MVCANQPQACTSVCGCGRPGDCRVTGARFRYVKYTSRFSPLKPPVSPESMEGVDQVVVESPTSYDAPVAALDMASVTLRSRRCQCICRPIGCERTLILALWMSSPCLRCPQKLTDIYPASPLFSHWAHRLHRLRALCWTRRLGHITAPSESGYISVYNGPCHELASLVGDIDPAHGCFSMQIRPCYSTHT